MNVRRFLGLESAYSYILMHENYLRFSRFAAPYVINEQLRETPIIPDYSFRVFQNNPDSIICDYFNPLVNGKPMFIQLSKKEYDEYMFIRNNAFYTPYGVMVLLNQPMLSCTNSFQLEDDSLIPENRNIEPVDTRMVRSRGGYIGATFFADYVLENIILKPTNTLLYDSDVSYNTRALCPVLMKRIQLNPNIPVFDVQFKDLMAFDTMISYDMYMLAVSNYINGRPSSAEKLNFRINPNNRVFKCYPIEYMQIKENDPASVPQRVEYKQRRSTATSYVDEERRKRQEQAKRDEALWSSMRTNYNR